MYDCGPSVGVYRVVQTVWIQQNNTLQLAHSFFWDALWLPLRPLLEFRRRRQLQSAGKFLLAMVVRSLARYATSTARVIKATSSITASSSTVPAVSQTPQRLPELSNLSDATSRLNVRCNHFVAFELKTDEIQDIVSLPALR